MTNKNTQLAHWEISFEEYKKALEPYTLDYVAKKFQKEILMKILKNLRKTSNFS